MKYFKCLLFISVVTFSQEAKKWKLDFQLDNRFSSIRNRSVTIFGAKVGVSYKEMTNFGIGVSFIINPVEVDFINKQTQEQGTSTINFWYISLYNDWFILKRERWKIFITEQIGFGKPRYTREIDETIIQDANVSLVVNELSAQAHYKILPWLGAGAGGGYRHLWNKNSPLKNTFNAPILIGKLILYPEEIFNF